MSKLDFVFDLGGSIVNPGKLSADFLQRFKELVIHDVKEGKTFGITVGGGTPTRVYQSFLRENFPVNNDDLDWVGIRFTRVNAELVRIMFKEYAYPMILESPEALLEYPNRYKIFIFSGWKPGWSTDYVAVLVAKRFNVKRIFSLTNIKGVHPVENGALLDGSIIPRLSWVEYEKMIAKEWIPGMRVPFDPVATKEAQREGIEVVILEGKRLLNLKNALDKKSFLGTIIS